MHKIRFGMLLAGSLFFLTNTVSAQMKGWEVGGWLGASNYFGDLNTNWRLNRTKPAGGLGARYNFNDRLSVRFGVNVGAISAADADSKNVYERRRNLSFRSILVEATPQLEFNFLPYVHGHRDFYYTPYMFLGPTFYHFNPLTTLNGKTYRLSDYGTEGQFKGEEYNLFQGAITYGMGFKMDLSYRWSLDFHISARKLFTDYLDDVSGAYADPRDISALHGDIAAQLADRSEEPRIGQQGRQRGNGKSNDTYAMVGAGVMYYFGHIRCPRMSN